MPGHGGHHSDSHRHRARRLARRPRPGAVPVRRGDRRVPPRGKHFVPPRCSPRSTRSARRPAALAAHRRARRFLDTALDKCDARFDNPSYLALDQLGAARRRRRRRRPRPRRRAPRPAARRCSSPTSCASSSPPPTAAPACCPSCARPRGSPRSAAVHGLRAIRPALERLGLDGASRRGRPAAAARRVCRRGRSSDLTPAERRLLALTAPPGLRRPRRVHVHPRAAVLRDDASRSRGVQLQARRSRRSRTGDGAAAAAIDRGRRARAARGGAAVLARRDDGAAVVPDVPRVHRRRERDPVAQLQARREPVPARRTRARLDSPAYDSVPERARAGPRRPGDARRGAADAPRPRARSTPRHREQLGAAMQRFEATLLRWRKTHHSTRGADARRAARARATPRASRTSRRARDPGVPAAVPVRGPPPAAVAAA